MFKFFKRKEKCKVIDCNNRVYDGKIIGEDPSLKYGYCQIHKLEGLVREVEAWNKTIKNLMKKHLDDLLKDLKFQLTISYSKIEGIKKKYPSPKRVRKEIARVLTEQTRRLKKKWIKKL